MVAAWHTLELVRGGKQHWHDACGAPAHLRLEAVAHRVLVEQQQAEELQPETAEGVAHRRLLAGNRERHCSPNRGYSPG